MKQTIKMICLTFVAAAFSLLLSIGALADGINGISVSDSAPKRGKTFSVTLYVPPTENADTASVKISFDERAFDVTEWAPDVPGSISNKADGIIALSAANADRFIILENGLTLTAKFTVKDDAPDGVYNFKLVDSSISFFNEETSNFDELWLPEAKTAVVTVGTGVSSETEDNEDIIDIEETESDDTIIDMPAENSVDIQTPNTAEQNRPEQTSGKTAAVFVTILLAALLTIVLLILSKLRK